MQKLSCYALAAQVCSFLTSKFREATFTHQACKRETTCQGNAIPV